jgi:nitrile hydratase accessory protein
MTAPVVPEVTAMTGAAAPPRRNGELVFEAPWQGRAFGMALALVERLGLPWAEFQQRLIAEIAARPVAPYYDCWLAALERLVVDHGVCSANELAGARQRTERGAARP